MLNLQISIYGSKFPFQNTNSIKSYGYGMWINSWLWSNQSQLIFLYSFLLLLSFSHDMTWQWLMMKQACTICDKCDLYINQTLEVYLQNKIIGCFFIFQFVFLIFEFITTAMHIKFELPLMLLLGIVTLPLSGWDALDTVWAPTSHSVSEREIWNNKSL